MISAYEAIVTLPAVVPFSVVFTAANWSALSSHIQPTLEAVPLSTIRPESLLGVPVSPEDNTVSGSATDTFVVFTVVVVPDTVKLPSTVKLPVTVGLASSATLT